MLDELTRLKRNTGLSGDRDCQSVTVKDREQSRNASSQGELADRDTRTTARVVPVKTDSPQNRYAFPLGRRWNNRLHGKQAPSRLGGGESRIASKPTVFP